MGDCCARVTDTKIYKGYNQLMATIKELHESFDKIIADDSLSRLDLDLQLNGLWSIATMQLAKELDKDPESDATSELVSIVEAVAAQLKANQYGDVPEAD